jgi:hypothetical protein
MDAQHRLAVAVAKDVLKQTDRRSCQVQSGLYLSAKAPAAKTSKAAARSIQKNCRACAIGHAFLSIVALRNKFKFVADEDGFADVCDMQMRDRLSEAFSQDQLVLIENTFEGWFGKYFFGSQEYRSVESFYRRYQSDRARLRAIMRNIVANRGEFVLPVVA